MLIRQHEHDIHCMERLFSRKLYLAYKLGSEFLTKLGRGAGDQPTLNPKKKDIKVMSKQTAGPFFGCTNKKGIKLFGKDKHLHS